MKKYSLVALVLSFTFLLTSCLKDENIEDQVYGMKGIEDTKLIEVSQSPENVFSLDYAESDTSFALVTLHLNSSEPATEDISVTLIPDESSIASYNEENGTTYEVAPASIYTLDNLTVTIPKGSREGSVMITTNPLALSAGEYALAFKLGQISNPGYVVSKNYSSIITFIGVKNKYHGTYNGVGIFHHPTLGDRTFDLEKELTTVDPNSVLADLGDVGPGSKMILTVNADNTVKIAPAGSTPNIQLYGGAAENYYDPATKAFHLHYGYTTSAPRIVEEVITRLQ